jgi:hypothetical protein
VTSSKLLAKSRGGNKMEGVVEMLARAYIHRPSHMIHNHNTTYVYNSGYATAVVRDVTLSATTKASTQPSCMLAVEVWVTSSPGRSCSPSIPQAHTIQCLFQLRLRKQTGNVSLNEMAYMG